MRDIPIRTESITLDQFLKWANIVGSGGQAKNLIKSGLVSVNEQVETQRAKRLYPNDVIYVEGDSYRIVRENSNVD